MDASRIVAQSRFATSVLHPRLSTRCTPHQALSLSTRPLSCLTPPRRSVLHAPATPHAPTFASTHAFRSWDPRALSAGSKHDPTTSTHADRQRDLNKTDSPSCSTTAESEAPPATSHPFSARAYRVRLQQGNYSSLRELARAAYAPSPLHVLVDLLRLSTATTPQQVHGSTPKTGVHHALARALDVQWVLNATIAEARETVLAAETLGDAASHTALQELLRDVDAFSNAVDSCAQNAPADVARLAADAHVSARVHGNEEEDLQASLSNSHNAGHEHAMWVLPEATYATLQRGILQLAAVVGAHLHALSALDELIALHERQQRAQSRKSQNPRVTGSEDGEESFSMDDALVLVDAAAQQCVQPLTAQDHLCAMQACSSEHRREFRTALSLYHRFAQHVTAGRFAATSDDFTEALAALARSSRTTTDFTELRALLVKSEAAAAVPVSVPLYTALIEAASRAVEEPQRMAIALSLYRRLRDGALTPSSDTYAALIACCASIREPTQAFAFYHEARQVCGVASFTPRVYTNLLLSYSTGGFGADARKTLDVLVEAGAPLSRASFHAALASAVTVREAQEMIALMTDRYHIIPTPHTYAYLVRAIAMAPAGLSTALQLFDVHEDALRSLARLSSSASASGGEWAEDAGSRHGTAVGEDGGGVAVSTSVAGVALEPMLLEQYPLYVRALEHALMRLRVDPSQDPRLKSYLTPLVRVAQQRMNAFTEMPPQSPLRVPDKERLCIAVLAADVLANLDEWVVPFMSHYSVLVIPYSAVVSLQKGGGRRVEGAMVKGASAGLHDAVWRETAGGGEHDALVEHRRRRLVRFLAEHREVVHLVSLEEELRWSCETRRYGVGITDLFARPAAVALHLARQPTESASARLTDATGGSVYAQHPNASIVLVSTNYQKCGKYVVALKQMNGREGSAGLQEALRRVSYHNPRTNPNWVPPSLSITQQQQRQQKQQQDKEATQEMETKSEKTLSNTSSLPSTQVENAPSTALEANAASALYQRLLHTVHDSSAEAGLGTESHEDTACPASSPSLSAAAATAEEGDEMDAALLMTFLNE